MGFTWFLNPVIFAALSGICQCYDVDWHSIVERSRVGDGNAETARLIDKELTNFRLAMERERNSMESPLSDANIDQVPLFREPDDFYLHDTWRTDASQQLHLSNLVIASTASLGSAVVQVDMVTVAATRESCVLIATSQELTVACHGQGGHQRITNSKLEGVASVAAMTADGAISIPEQVVVFILHETKGGQRPLLTWWDVFNSSLLVDDGSSDWLPLGSLHVDSDASFIKLVPVHVTDSVMVAVGGRHSMEMYTVSASGASVTLIPCTQFEAREPTDLESFHINGQLYLVVASRHPGASVVWKYDSRQDTFVFHHGLDDDELESLEYFRRGHQHHLATAGPGGASIYRWVGSRLLRTQHWARPASATQPKWHHVSRYRMTAEATDDVVLLLASDAGVALYTWNDRQKLFVTFLDTDCIRWERKISAPMYATVFDSRSETARDFCIADERCEGIVTAYDLVEYAVGTNASEVSVPFKYYEKKVHQSVDHCWPLSISNITLTSFGIADAPYVVVLVGSGNSVTALNAYLDNRKSNDAPSGGAALAYRLDAELQSQLASLQRTRTVLDGISRDLTKSTPTTRTAHSVDVCPDVQARLESLRRKLSDADAELQTLLHRGSTIRVNKTTTLKSLTVTGHATLSGGAKIDTINSLNVSQFLTDTVTNDTTEKISGVKTFTGKITIEGPIEVRKRLNGHRFPDDYLLLDRDQTTNGTLEFSAPVTVAGDFKTTLVNGVDLAKEVVVLDDGERHLVTAEKTFVEAVTVTDEVVLLAGATINGFRPSAIAANTVTSRPSLVRQRISGNKTFVRAKVLGNLTSGRVGGIDLVHLARTTVRRDQRANVVATKRFTGPVRVEGNGSRLMVLKLNGLHLPEDVVLRSDNRPVSSVTRKNFRGEVTVSGNLVVGGRLDGLNMSDLAFVGGDQQLCGHKIFTGAITAPDFAFRNTGESLAAKRAIIHGSLRLSGSLNGNDLDELYRDVVFRNETDLIFTAPVTFDRPQSLDGQVHILGRLNGLDLEKDFVLADHDNVVTGTKTFASPLTFEGNVALNGKWDGVDLKELDRTSVRTDVAGDTVVSGRKTFVDGITVEHLRDDSVARVELRNLRPENVYVEKNVSVTGKVNSVDFSALLSRRINLSTDQNITGSLLLGNKAEVGHLELLGRLNGVDFGELRSDVLWKNSDRKQVVTGQKKFVGRVVAPYVTTKQGINGISVAEVARRSVRVDKTTFRSDHLQFRAMTVDGSMTVDDVNGHRFSELVKHSVTGPRPGPIKGVKEFDDLNVKGNIWVSGMVNGLDLAQDVLTTGGRQVVTGHYTFVGDVKLSGDVMVAGVLRVGSVSDGTGSYANRTVVLDGDVHVDALRTGGLLNGIDVGGLREGDDGWMTSAGVVHFKGGAHFGKRLKVLGTINGFDYPKFFEQVVLNDDSIKVITARKEFSESLTATNIVMESNLRVRKTFNQINITAIANDNPTLHKVIEGPVRIPHSLIIHGNVTISHAGNGDPQPGVDSKCGTGSIKELKVLGNVFATSVNERNLTTVAINTLRTGSEEQVITGQKTITGSVRFHGRVTGFESEVESEGRAADVSDEPDEIVTVFPARRCRVSECSVVDAIEDSLRLSDHLRRKIKVVQRSPMFSASASIFKVFGSREGGGIKLAVGFADCVSPMQMYSWNVESGQFQMDSNIGLHNVKKMVPLVQGRRQLLLVHHLSCPFGNKTEDGLSVVHVRTAVIRKIDLRMFTGALLDVDVLQSGAGTRSHPVLALLHEGGRLAVDTLLAKGTVRRNAETVLPAGASAIRWLPEFGTGELLGARHILVEFGGAESVVYAVDGGRWQRHREGVRAVQLLASAALESVGTYVDRKGDVGLVMCTEEDACLIKFYGFNSSLGDNPWRVNDVMSDDNHHRVKSMSVLASHVGQQSDVYLAINRGSTVQAYLQTGRANEISNLVELAQFPISDARAVQWFSIDGRLFLAILSEYRWILHEF